MGSRRRPGHRVLMVKAMIMEPSTINGLRSRRRSPIFTVLYLIDIISQAGDQSICSKGVKLCIGKLLYMVIDSLPEFRCKANTGLCCKELGCDADGQTGSRHQDQDKKSLNDVRTVVSRDTHINDLGNNYRNKQVKHNFQKFEEKVQECFLFCNFSDRLREIAF